MGKRRRGPSAADFAKLQREVAEQRQLIIQMLQMEQQRYDFLLRLLQSGGQAAPGAALPPAPTLPGSGATPESGRGAAASKSPAEHGAAADHAAASAAVATVTGRITTRAGTLKDTYVYLDQVRGSPARGHTLEIKQKDKQFWPEVAAVQRGTTVTFPNFDAVFHNVFSPSGKNSFDLGSYRSGDQPRSAVLTTPGVVDVYCNIHSRMHATVLVVPSATYAKVAADGTFRLDNVPVGARHIVAFSPGAKPVTQKVDVLPAGAKRRSPSSTRGKRPTSTSSGSRTVPTRNKVAAMISARNATSVACAVVAIAAAGAGLVVRRTQERAQRAAAQKIDALTTTARDAVSGQIEMPLRSLESEVKRAAARPAAPGRVGRRRGQRDAHRSVRQRGLVGALSLARGGRAFGDTASRRPRRQGSSRSGRDDVDACTGVRGRFGTS